MSRAWPDCRPLSGWFADRAVVDRVSRQAASKVDDRAVDVVTTTNVSSRLVRLKARARRDGLHVVDCAGQRRSTFLARQQHVGLHHQLVGLCPGSPAGSRGPPGSSTAPTRFRGGSSSLAATSSGGILACRRRSGHRTRGNAMELEPGEAVGLIVRLSLKTSTITSTLLDVVGRDRDVGHLADRSRDSARYWPTCRPVTEPENTDAVLAGTPFSFFFFLFFFFLFSPSASPAQPDQESGRPSISTRTNAPTAT